MSSEYHVDIVDDFDVDQFRACRLVAGRKLVQSGKDTADRGDSCTVNVEVQGVQNCHRFCHQFYGLRVVWLVTDVILSTR